MLNTYQVNNQTQIASTAIEAAKAYNRSIYPSITKENPNRFSFQVMSSEADQTVIKVVDTERVKIMPLTAIKFVYVTKIN